MAEVIEPFEDGSELATELKQAVLAEVGEDYADLDDPSIDAIIRSILSLAQPH